MIEMVGSTTPEYFVEPQGDRAFAVRKKGFRGGVEPIATYNYEHQANDVATFLNGWARSEVYGTRRSGTGRS
jgi:hypothetical protein